MHAAIMIIGWDQKGNPEGLYCGLDGLKAAQVAERAQATGKYKRLGRLTNPSYTPLPAFPVAKVSAAKATPALPVPALPVPQPPKPSEIGTRSVERRGGRA